MSKGTTTRSLRVNEDLWQRCLAFLESRNRNSAEEPWVMSDLVRVALEELLAHRWRSRTWRSRRREAVEQEGLAPAARIAAHLASDRLHYPEGTEEGGEE